MSANIHIHANGESVDIAYRPMENGHGKFAVVDVVVGDTTVKYFLDDIESVDKLADAFTALAMDLRVNEGWTQKENKS
jgi:kynurenine formamidase